MLNKELDLEPYRAALERDGRVVIPDFLEPAAADRVYQSLDTEVPWRLAFFDNRRYGRDAHVQVTQAEFAALPPGQARALRAEVMRQAREGYQYLYQFYNLDAGEPGGESAGETLYRLRDELRSPESLAMYRELTGDPALDDVYAHATLYLAGNFLKTHEDVTGWDDRRYAYVLGMTKDWHPDMGGVLQFLDEEGGVVDTCVPGYNSLTLFKVPTPHLVSTVAQWATGKRMAITGWLRARGESDKASG